MSVTYSKGRAEWTIIALCGLITKNIKEVRMAWLIAYQKFGQGIKENIPSQPT